MFKRILRLYGRLDPLFACAQTGLLLAVRLYWGFQFAQDGYGKLTHLSRVAEFFAAGFKGFGIVDIGFHEEEKSI